MDVELRMHERPRSHAPGGPSLIERHVRKIVNARSVTFGLALTFIGLSSPERS